MRETEIHTAHYYRNSERSQVTKRVSRTAGRRRKLQIRMLSMSENRKSYRDR